MLDHPLAFLWALLGALIMKEVSLKELSQLISFIQKTTKTFTVSNTDLSYFSITVFSKNIFLLVDAQTPPEWIVLKDTDCLGNDDLWRGVYSLSSDYVLPSTPASSIYACIEQCHGLNLFF